MDRSSAKGKPKWALSGGFETVSCLRSPAPGRGVYSNDRKSTESTKLAPHDLV
jgi:hypothetical protein